MEIRDNSWPHGANIVRRLMENTDMAVSCLTDAPDR